MKLNTEILQKLYRDAGVFLWDGQTPICSRSNQCLLFERPVRTLALYLPSTPSHLKNLFKEIEKGLNNGLYAAGWLSYEVGYLMVPKLYKLIFNIKSSLPLAWFGLYKKPQILPADYLKALHLDDDAKEKLKKISLKLNTSKQEFIYNVDKIHSYIRAGHTYQINYTIRGSFDLPASNAFGLFGLLRQRQQTLYRAFIRPFKDLQILSLSPELFLGRHGNRIWTKPMKGTAPRGKTQKEDRKLASMLKNDEKNRAENVMIVDLLRNDLGRVCQIGTVQVPELFCIESYKTLFQMTSTIQGRLTQNTSWSEILKSIFPCGSITGAPKIRSMEIIAELEKSPRNIYTGAIGYICPDNSAIFNVAIRTLTINKNVGEIGIGAGITIGSSPEEEYNETVLKARFLTEKIQ